MLKKRSKRPDTYDVADRLYKLADGQETVAAELLRTEAAAVDARQHTYKVALDLKCGARLQMLLHPWAEHRWIFNHEYRLRTGPRGLRGKVKALCEWSCVVDYHEGRLQNELDISMHIIIPERLGKRIAYGVDISPGAKTFLQFYYEQAEDSLFYLAEFSQGGRARVDVRHLTMGKKEDQVMQPVELPFPLVIADRIEREFQDDDGSWAGDFKAPFPFRVTGDDPLDEVRWIYFPEELV